MKQSKKIGLFGGTFDPIHFGHLNLAIQMMEKCQLDEIWFIPTYLNPLKETKPPVDFDHRCEMIRLAIQPIAAFSLKTLEKNLPVPSYTVNTLTALMESLTENERTAQFYLILGEDTLKGFMSWNLPDEIVEAFPLLVGSRLGYWDRELSAFSLLVRQSIEKGLIATTLLDISSTDIRNRLVLGKFCGYLLPQVVLDYIEKNRLYKN